MSAPGQQSKVQNCWSIPASCCPVALNTEKCASLGPCVCGPAGISVAVSQGDAKPGEARVVNLT